MSDHVANLVGRTLGTAPVVLPRIPSRYAAEGGPGEIAYDAGYRPSAHAVAPEILRAPATPEAAARQEPRPEAAPAKVTIENRVTDVRELVERIVSQTAPPLEAARESGPPVSEKVFLKSAVAQAPAAPERLLVQTPQPLRQVTAPLAQFQQTGMAEQARPVVRVHIGSVEVRAVQQSEPKRAPAPAAGASPVSLDSYLRGRKGSAR